MTRDATGSDDLKERGMSLTGAPRVEKSWKELRSGETSEEDVRGVEKVGRGETPSKELRRDGKKREELNSCGKK